MRRTIVVALLGAVGLAAAWSLASWAQEGMDSTACQQACYDQKEQCVTACGERDDPVECEERCDDQLSNCLEECETPMAP